MTGRPQGIDPEFVDLWDEAEEYYQRWRSEEFDINGEKAKGIVIEHGFLTEVEQFTAPKKAVEEARKRGRLENTALLYFFTNAFTEWPAKRLIVEDAHWVRPAREVVMAFTAIRAHGCLLDGRNTKARLSQKDSEINTLQQRFEDATKKLGAMEDRLRQCSDEKVELENRVKDQKERIDNTRAEDIRDSMKSKSETGEVKEE